MQDFKPQKKKILVIEDDLSIRLVITKLIEFLYKKQNIEVYSSEDGVQGLGYAFILKPDLIIIDSTLPKYSGRELLEFLKTNEKFKDSKVILISENKEAFTGLPNNYSQLSKTDLNFLKNILNNISGQLYISYSDSRLTTFLKFLASRAIERSNTSDVILNTTNNGIFNKIKFLLNETFSSLYLSLFIFILGRKLSDTNIAQEKVDLSKYRSKTRPAVALSLAILAIICFQVFFILASVVSATFLSNKKVAAASYSWDGGGADNNWSTCANWSSDICPTSLDVITFNSTSTKDSVVDAAWSGTINSLNITTGYTGTITLARSLTISTTYSQSTGSFNASSHQLTVQTGFTLSGGNFTASSDLTTIFGAFTVSGTPVFNHNSGIVKFTSTTGVSSVLSCNNITFNLVQVLPTSATKTINSNCNLPLGNNPIFGGSSNIVLNGTISGTGALTIAGSGSTTTTVNTGASITGFSDYLTNGQALTVAGATLNFSSYASYTSNNGGLTLSSGSISLPNNADINGAVTISGGTLNLPSSSNVYIGGAFTVSGSPIININNTTFIFDGISTGTLACNNLSFYAVRIANTSGTRTVSTDCNMPLGNNPSFGGGSVILNGTLSGSGVLTTTGTFTINSTGVISGFSGFSGSSLTIAGANINASSFSVFTANSQLSLSSGSLSLPANSDINGNTFITGGTFTASSGTTSLGGSLTISGSAVFNHNNGIVTIDGSSPTISLQCNNVTFNRVNIANQSGSTVSVNTNCNLPLGNNPTLGTGDSTSSVVLNGTLSGSGTINTGNITINVLSNLSGFSGLRANNPGVNSVSASNILTLGLGGSLNAGSYSEFIINGKTSIGSSSSLTLPNNANLKNDISVEGGTVTSGTNLDLDGGLIISSGNFVAPSGTLNLGGNLTISGTGTFTHNNGNIVIDSSNTATLSCNSAVLNSLTFNNAGSKTIESNCSLPLGANPTLSGAGDVIVRGTLSGNGIIYKATGVITLESSADISDFNGINIYGLTLNGSILDASTFSTAIIRSDFILNSGSTFTQPANLEIRGNLSLNASTFNHNNGTISLTGGDQSFLNGNWTIYNLTKIANLNNTLFFKESIEISILNNLVLKGGVGSTLSLRSAIEGQQYYINAENTDFEYLDVSDYNNSSGVNIDTDGKNIVDSGNNYGWNFFILTVGTINGNVVNGSFTNIKDLLFSFEIPNPNSLSIGFQIQIDNNSDFTSPEIDFKSALAIQSSFNFMIGQNVNGGEYISGSEANFLVDGSYYVRVRAFDNQNTYSEFVNFNAGNVVYKLDTVKPTADVKLTLNTSTLEDLRDVTITSNASDNISAVSSMLMSTNPSFAGANYVPYSNIKNYTLPIGTNSVTLYFKFKDEAGNESIVYSASFSLPAVTSSNENISTNNTEEQISEVISFPISYSNSENKPDINSYPVYYTSANIVARFIVQVFKEDGAPLSNSKVTLVELKKESTTDTNGIAIFENVPQGNYTILGINNGKEFTAQVVVTDTQNITRVELGVNYIQTILLTLVVVLGISAFIFLIYFLIKRTRIFQKKENSINT